MQIEIALSRRSEVVTNGTKLAEWEAWHTYESVLTCEQQLWSQSQKVLRFVMLSFGSG